MKPIPYGRQHLTEADIQAVVEVLKSDYLTQGPKIAAFETAFSEYVGSKYAVAVANGTAALHLCTLVLGVEPGNKVITTPITFAASANCVRFCGGEVVFADIDPETYLLDIHKVRALLEAAPRGTYQGLIPVDFAGRAINLEAFRQLANEYRLWIIEDACHAPGGYFTDSHGRKQNCGNGEYADLAIFSFHPVKHIATGEGGMVTTNNPVLYQKLLKLRTHGITRHPEEFSNSLLFASGEPSIVDSPEPPQWPGWYMEMQDLGYNYRITDFQAALGLSQLQRAEEGLARRKAIAAKYSEAFENKPFINGQSGFVEGHAYHLYVIETENRIGLYNHLREHNIFAQIHYIPCHLMPYYRQFGWKEGDMPHSECYYAHCISLPMYPTLTLQEQEYVIETTKNSMRSLAIIPARGGSKRIPRKNIKDFLGKPIIAYSIEAALNSDLFDEVMVSTDDEEIATLSQKLGAHVPFLRSAENANDYATTVDVLIEVIGHYESAGQKYEYGCCLYPTAPFITPALLAEAKKQIVGKGYDCIFPILPFTYPIQRALKLGRDGRIELFQPEFLTKRSQDLIPAFHDSGQFYWFSIPAVLEHKTLWTKNTGALTISEMDAHDIDNLEDWKIAEFKYKAKFGHKEEE